jgi:hypothetical protein
VTQELLLLLADCFRLEFFADYRRECFRVLLCHPEGHFQVSAARLIDKCGFFKANLPLVGVPFAFKSPVPIEFFREFVAALHDGAVENTVNFAGRSLFCTEFGFEALEFRSCAVLAGLMAEVDRRLSALEDRALARNRDTAEAQADLLQLSAAHESLRVVVDGV